MSTKEKRLEELIRNIPYPDQIKDMEISDTDIRFTWRGDRFNIEVSGGLCEEIKDGLRHSSNVAMLLMALMGRRF